MTMKHTILKDNSVGTYKNVPSGSKFEINTNKKQAKKQAVESLKKCNSKTSPVLIAEYLEDLFSLWETKPDHWLVLARRYTPKAINSVILEMIKAGRRSSVDLNTPGKYFTYLLTTFHKPRRHPKRKIYRNDVTRDEYGIYHHTKTAKEIV